MKGLIFIKIVILTVIAMYYGGLIQIGEKKGSAKEEYIDVDEALAPKKKSLLEELFTLPEIDVSTANKEEIEKYLSIVERKRIQIDERLAILETREQKMSEIEESVGEKIRLLEEEKRFFSETLQKEKTIQKDRLEKLIAFYQKMSPKKAAPVIEKLDKDLVVQLFNRMPQKQTMGILSAMDPEISVKLTEYYGRLRSGKEYELLKEINKDLVDEFKEACE